jgi:Domain of unknown function (DUF4148)
MPTPKTLIVAALVSAFGAAAMAQPPAAEPQAPKTRAEVRAELAQAQRDGSLVTAIDSYDPLRWVLGKPQRTHSVPASDSRAAGQTAPLAQSSAARAR